MLIRDYKKNKEMLSTRTAYGEALLELAREDERIVAISADTSKSMCTDYLSKDFPNRFYDVGIAEQNMMVIAAGLSSTGKIVFASTYAVFSSMRTCEQIRTFICYPNLNVKIVSGLSGLTAGIEGVTHLSVEDIAIMRVIPNLVIINPADSVATKLAVKAAASLNGPVYIRIGRDASTVIFDEDYKNKFRIGTGIELLNYGEDFLVLSTGYPVMFSIEAVNRLKEKNIFCNLIEIHTIKPLDEEIIIEAASKVKNVVVIEEHSVIGGLGSAVCELLSERLPRRVIRIGLPDVFLESGLPDDLRNKYGLNSESIVKRILEIV